MKNALLILITLMSAACASTSKQAEVNCVSHETLGQSFVAEKKMVCDHFAKSNEMLVVKKNYMAKYFENGEEVSKLTQFEVNKMNVPAWHCGETAWTIPQNVSEIIALGRDVPMNQSK